jgi:hypothetical protein
LLLICAVLATETDRERRGPKKEREYNMAGHGYFIDEDGNEREIP